MSKIYVRAPHLTKVRHVYGGAVPRLEACIHVDGRTGEVCGAPTQDGAHRCPSCAERLKAKSGGARYTFFKPGYL